jgi:glutaredoxin
MLPREPRVKGQASDKAATKPPIVYTLASCPACKKLKEDWTLEGKAFEERQVDQSQAVLDEALNYGDMVPIVVYPDKRVEMGYKGMIG